ncbi:MAG: hypothetical protein J6S67_00595 [Methanobrevibacter sp.]|nr:hypothetical protein [Methanobrevibacter sp.]
MSVKSIALCMCRNRTVEDAFIRAEAEKMMGCKFEEMTPQQRLLATEMICAFGLSYFKGCCDL